MVRFTLAMAAASLSIASLSASAAAPQASPRPSQPVNVTNTPSVIVANPVVPVAVSNTDPVPVFISNAPVPVANVPARTLKSNLFVFTLDEGVVVHSEAKVFTRTLTKPVDLEGISAQLTSFHGCLAKFDVMPAAGSPISLFRVYSLPAAPASGYLPLPDLYLESGDTIRVEVASGGDCYAFFSIIGVIP